MVFVVGFLFVISLVFFASSLRLYFQQDYQLKNYNESISNEINEVAYRNAFYEEQLNKLGIDLSKEVEENLASVKEEKNQVEEEMFVQNEPNNQTFYEESNSSQEQLEESSNNSYEQEDDGYWGEEDD